MQNTYKQWDPPDLQFPTCHARAVWLLRNASTPSIDLWNSAQNPSWITLADTDAPATPPESRSDWSSLCPRVSEALITAQLGSYQRTETVRQSVWADGLQRLNPLPAAPPCSPVHPDNSNPALSKVTSIQIHDNGMGKMISKILMLVIEDGILNNISTGK